MAMLEKVEQIGAMQQGRQGQLTRKVQGIYAVNGGLVALVEAEAVYEA